MHCFDTYLEQEDNSRGRDSSLPDFHREAAVIHLESGAFVFSILLKTNLQVRGQLPVCISEGLENFDCDGLVDTVFLKYTVELEALLRAEI